MCRQAAASQRVEAIRALNAGIILLAIPPAAIIGGIAWFTYRHRNGFQDPAPSNRSERNGVYRTR